jgi:AcrR family transcriptional regulator
MSPNKQAARSEATRQAIVAAAAKLFGTKGFFDTIMDEIASAAGVAKGAVYHHYPSKQSIFEAVLRYKSAALASELRDQVTQAPDVLAMLTRGTAAYFAACADGPTGRIILKDGPAVLGWARWREIDEEHFGQAIPRSLSVAMEQGLIDPQPVPPLARLLLGAITEAAVACAESEAPAKTGRDHAAAFERLIGGLRRSRSGAQPRSQPSPRTRRLRSN